MQSLVNLYEFISGQNNDESDDDILLPKNLENDLLLCLTKMRAHNYNIEVLENDSTLVLKARKQPICHLTTAHLTTELVLHECQKLQQGLNCNNDWWLSEMAGLRIIKSKSEPSFRKVGNLKLCQWDNVRVVSKEDWTLQDFLDHMQNDIGVSVEAIIQNGRSIFMRIMPTHAKKCQKSINSLVKFDENHTALVHVGITDVEDLVTVLISS